MLNKNFRAPMRTGLTTVILLASLVLAACASNGTPDAQGAVVNTSSTASTTTTTHAAQSNVALTAIRMLDRTRGWALTEHAVLKTTDGGQHWHDVSPAKNALTPASAADFMDASYAWIAVSAFEAQHGIIKLLYTTDGAAHWQSSTINDPQATGTDRPHFINRYEGWLEVGTGAAMSHESVDIFHTIDGGRTWHKLSSTDIINARPQHGALSFEGDKTGISFKSAHTGWATAATPATDAPWLYVTHDGGKTWSPQALPLLKGVSNANYVTTPPVFFGNDGLLPVQIGTATIRGIDLYVTHNGGLSWQPTTLTRFSSNDTYVLDMHHIWATDEKNFYASSDGGYSWSRLAASSQSIVALSFVDATTGWAIGSTDSKPPVLLHTADGGRSWHQINYSIQ